MAKRAAPVIEHEEEPQVDDLLHRMALAMERVDPEDRLYFEDVDTTVIEGRNDAEGNPLAGPLFSVSEVAKVFFGKTPHWIRWLEGQGRTTLEGRPVATTRTEHGSRQYTLADIELLAHALHENDAIDMAQLVLAVTTARNIALAWRILK
jgi:hypothetical protein